jgi:Mlc titration factor MtfA (ptsG expression regulator)
MFGFFKRRRRKKLLASPLPDEWQDIIGQNLAIFPLLSSGEQERLTQAAAIIAAERPFVGLAELKISEEIKVTISAQAALLLLGEEGYYFDRVGTIYVQPSYHKTRLERSLGGAVLVEDGVFVEGQALEQGEVRLAWNEVLYGCRDPADGENVVLHEFAHHLDELDGYFDGVPPLSRDADRRRWVEVFDQVLEQLRAEQANGHETFLHDAAAENRAELFAYATECFFEQPLELEEEHPELFDCLKLFYKTDTRRWFALDGERER